MIEERKRELRQLLADAKGNLVIRFGHGGYSSLPVDVYRKYLQRHWASYGVECLAFWFPSFFVPHIVEETTKSRLLNFLREELALLIDRDYVISVTYDIESEPTNTSHSLPLGLWYPSVYFILERLLEITIGRGIEEAVSTLDRFSCAKGVHGFFRYIVFLDGISVREPVQVAEGVRLSPLPFEQLPEELTRYLPSFRGCHPHIDKALLIIDCPGFSIFYTPSTDLSSRSGPPSTDHPIEAPPFRFESHKANFPNFNVNDFCKTFCQALSLVYNFPIQILHTRWFCEEDKSFNRTNDVFGMPSALGSFRGYGITEGNDFAGDIEKAKGLYDILYNSSEIRERLRIPIDRWIKSKASEDPVDKMIDLGIALEAFYLSDIEEPTELSFRLRLHASWHLKKNEKDRRKLMKKFAEIYKWRSSVVHKGTLPNKRKKTPFTHDEVRTFIEDAQDLCHRSIMKVLEKKKIPDWSGVILGAEQEQTQN